MKSKKANIGALSIIILCALLFAGSSKALLDHNYSDSVKTWGPPVKGTLDETGNGVVDFRCDGLPVSIAFVAFQAQRMTCSLPGTLTQKEMEKVLKTLGGGEHWYEFVAPGRGEIKTDLRRWLRNDDQAMAEWRDNVLNIVGSTREAPPEGDKLPPQVELPKPPTEEQITLATRQIEGLWRTDLEEHSFMVLNFNTNGTVQLCAFGSYARHVKDFNWQTIDPRAFHFAINVPVKNSDTQNGIQPVGMAKIEQDSLKWKNAETLPSDLKDFLTPLKNTSFVKISSMPPWKPQPPANLPSKGTLKADALKILGEPNGKAGSGITEIFVYDWGKVMFKKGVVDSYF